MELGEADTAMLRDLDDMDLGVTAGKRSKEAGASGAKLRRRHTPLDLTRSQKVQMARG